MNFPSVRPGKQTLVAKMTLVQETKPGISVASNHDSADNHHQDLECHYYGDKSHIAPDCRNKTSQAAPP